jgi:two-component system chemotaxis sensor kinase CheA
MGGSTENDEIVREFLVESHENLDRLDKELLALESEPSRATLSSIFRTIHTIKGTCGFLGFGRLEAVTHAGENLLSKLRDGALAPNPEMVTVLLALVDAIRGILAGIEATGGEPEVDHADLIIALEAFLHGADSSRGVPPSSRLSSGSSTDGSSGSRHSSPAAAAPAAPFAAPAPSPPSLMVPPPSAAAAVTLAPAAISAAYEARPVVIPAAAPVPGARPPSFEATPMSAPVASTVPVSLEPSLQGDSETRLAVADQSVRVDVAVLDRLMDVVGELVLARNQILRFNSSYEDASFLQATQRLDLITTELQEGVMKTRMQPIGNIVGKFPRIVRDLALSLGKQVRLEMDGTETELDRTILEAIRDPLTHLVRNAVDHGIEAPDERRRAGKNVEGVVTFRAFHEGGQVNIEIGDDGRGILAEKVKERAIQRGLLTREEAARRPERELLQLIFLPGFSTADAVTNVSGRGVGMDVVKTNIERIGGTLDLQSRPGAGMQLRIKIPLTLAIIPALIVSAGSERYAIPQTNLIELVRLEREQASQAIETILGAKVYRLRGNLLPIVRLATVLAEPGTEPPAEPEDGAVNVVVVQADGRQFGLVVDDISDTQEIVVKPLGKALKSVAMFAGATILGDGNVALILDAVGLAQQASVLAEVREARLEASRQASATDAAADDRVALLLFGVHDEGRMAMPLSMVARLEEFPRSIVERVGGTEVVQYRGEIMPLVHVASIVPERRQVARGTSELRGSRDSVSVVVTTEGGRSVGLVVDRILDIVEESLAARRTSGRPGTLGSAVIQGRVTELIDVRGIVRETDSGVLPVGGGA